MHPGEPPEAGVDPVGDVYWVPDRWWGFRGTRTEDHPGACIAAVADIAMIKGTSQRPPYTFRQRYLRIEPDDHNGLRATTHFNLVPRRFSRFRLESLHQDSERWAGRLAPGDLRRLQLAIHRLFGAAS